MLQVIKNNRGQAIVEFVLIIPLVFLLIFAMLETGRYVHAAYEIEHASREAARIGAIGGSDTDIHSAVTLNTNGLDAQRVSVQIVPTEYFRDSGDQLTITVRYQFSPITPFLGAIYTDGMNLSTNISMRVE